MDNNVDAAEEKVPTPRSTASLCVAGLIRLVILALFIWYIAPDAASRGSGVGSHGTAGDGSFWTGINYGIIGLLTAGLIYPLAQVSARQHLYLFRKIRPIMVVQNLAVIIVVICMAAVLDHFLPSLDRSWLYRFPLNHGEAMNINLLPTTIKYLGPVYVLLLTLNLPSLAHSEEMSFRRGTRNWTHASLSSLRFGLVHCFVGVPMYIGFALSLGGLWFTYQYFKGGVDRSTVHHLTYNLIIIFALIVLLVKYGSL